MADQSVNAAFARGEIGFQHCPACGHRQAMVRPFCLACLRPDPEWQAASGDGTVVACTTQHRAPDPEWKARLPYAIALVDLVEGPRVMALAEPGLGPGAVVLLYPGGRHGLPFFTAKESR